MTSRLRDIRGRRKKPEPDQAEPSVTQPSLPEEALMVDVPSDDPLLAHLQQIDGPIELARLELDSPAVVALRENGVEMIVPLVSQGELIGLLNLGRRLSDQDYSTDDRKLLNSLSAQAAPAVRVAQLVRQQEAEAQERERMAQELRVARLIQQTLLPKQVPQITGWEVSAYYQPARAVGGDFYDFIDLEDGHLALVVGDVSDKGVPAALVMATCRTLLRAVSQRLNEPGEVLARVNDILVGDIPPNMFVTCLYARLEPQTGRLRFANAGHNLPYLRTEQGVVELRATGMPLGLMPDMSYEETEAKVALGESFLLSSDGLVEAHSPEYEMFGFPRLISLVGSHQGGAGLIDLLLAELGKFAGPEWEQEDDVTLVTAHHSGSRRPPRDQEQAENEWRTLAEFSVASQEGNERLAKERVVEAVSGLGLSEPRLERLKTAVAETTMNAIEHGNRFHEELPVQLEVLASDRSVKVRITDQGGGTEIAASEAPDLEAKLAGEQSPRGWGLFLIKNMCDEMNIVTNESHHTVEVVFHLSEEDR